MLVRQIAVGTMQNFVYLLADRAGGEGLVVDSGWEIDPIVNAAKEDDVKIKFAVATHRHSDHTSSLRELADYTGAKIVAHRRSPIEHDISAGDGDTLSLGEVEARVVYTPGHTEDSICLYDGENLFTGDTLFIGNCGRTDLPGGSSEELFRSLHDVILKLPPSTVIYPGHDYGDRPYRSLGEEALSNPVLSVRSYSGFLGVP
ncbi:MAG: MBL fold metallo-hydrolase [Nitrososphaerota archaeon]|jgi:glyoxylase-like metal-dependent hydrolase (beta-lactamase superfamily II)|nr:MBL fold metallo-hydrolase [Nitrososphaerota archaeon]